MSGKWSKKIISDNNLIYYLKYKPEDGKNCYFFILIDARKEKDFLKVIDSDKSFDLMDYGELIDSGMGDEAPDQLTSWIKNWYSK